MCEPDYKYYNGTTHGNCTAWQGTLTSTGQFVCVHPILKFLFRAERIKVLWWPHLGCSLDFLLLLISKWPSPISGLPSDLVAFMLIGFLFSDLKHKSLNSSCSFYCLLDFISLIWNTIPFIAVPVPVLGLKTLKDNINTIINTFMAKC